MFEVTRAPGFDRKVRVAIFRGTGRERTIVFASDPVRFRDLPPEIEAEVNGETPRLIAQAIPHERTPKLPPTSEPGSPVDGVPPSEVV